MDEINATLIESIKAIEPATTLDQSLAKILKAQAEENYDKCIPLLNISNVVTV